MSKAKGGVEVGGGGEGERECEGCSQSLGQSTPSSAPSANNIPSLADGTLERLLARVHAGVALQLREEHRHGKKAMSPWQQVGLQGGAARGRPLCFVFGCALPATLPATLACSPCCGWETSWSTRHSSRWTGRGEGTRKGEQTPLMGHAEDQGHAGRASFLLEIAAHFFLVRRATLNQGAQWRL